MSDPGPLCAECGACCKELPGAFFPDDFGIDLLEQVRAGLSEGIFAIDWWETLDSPMYFLRPSTKGKEGIIFDPSWGGECTFLTSVGCSRSRNEMPTECKGLEAKTTWEDTCKSTTGGKLGAAEAWVPYNNILKMIGESLERIHRED